MHVILYEEEDTCLRVAAASSSHLRFASLSSSLRRRLSTYFSSASFSLLLCSLASSSAVCVCVCVCVLCVVCV